MKLHSQTQILATRQPIRRNLSHREQKGNRTQRKPLHIVEQTLAEDDSDSFVDCSSKKVEERKRNRKMEKKMSKNRLVKE